MKIGETAGYLAMTYSDTEKGEYGMVMGTSLEVAQPTLVLMNIQEVKVLQKFLAEVVAQDFRRQMAGA